MKTISKIQSSAIIQFLITLTLGYFLLSCKPQQDVEPSITPELKAYYDLFVKEANSRNVSLSLPKDGFLLEFGKTPSPYEGYTYVQQNKVVIDSVRWKQNKNYESKREFIVFHELGHLLLEHEHDNTPLPNGEFKSLMFTYDNNPSPNSIYNWGIRRKYYIDELFNINTPAPDWSKAEYNPFPLSSSNRQLIAAQEFSQSTALNDYLKTLTNAQCQIIENNSLLNVKLPKDFGFYFSNDKVMALAGMSQDKIDQMMKSTNYEIEVRYRLKSGGIKHSFANNNDPLAISNFSVNHFDSGKLNVVASVFFNLSLPEPPLSLEGDFNIIRLVRQGPFFAFYLNNKLIHYSDMLRPEVPENATFVVFGNGVNTEFDLDYYRIYQR